MGEPAAQTAKISSPFHTFFKFSAPPQDDGNDVIVEGYASTEAMDDDGEVVDIQAIKDAWPAYMEWANLRQMHSGIAAGTVLEGHEDAKGWWIKARVSAKDSVDLVRKGVLKGFSIGGRKVQKIGNRIKSIILHEISLVDRPANEECAFSFGKMSEDNGVTTLELGEFSLTICQKNSKGAADNIADQSLIHGRGGVTAPTTGQSATTGNSAQSTENPMKAELFQKFVTATVELQKATDLTDGEKSFLETVAKGASMTDAQRAEIAATLAKSAGANKEAMQKCIDTMKAAGVEDDKIAAFAKEAGMDYTAAAKPDVTKGAAIVVAPATTDLTKYAKLDQVVTVDQFNQLTKRITVLAKYISSIPVQPREDWAADFVTKADDQTGNSALGKILAGI